MHTYIYIVISTQVKQNQNTISHNLISTLFTFENELFETKIQFPCTHITILSFQHKSNRTITCYTPRAKKPSLLYWSLTAFGLQYRPWYVIRALWRSWRSHVMIICGSLRVDKNNIKIWIKSLSCMTYNTILRIYN